MRVCGAALPASHPHAGTCQAAHSLVRGVQLRSPSLHAQALPSRCTPLVGRPEGVRPRFCGPK
eukprot:6775711-Alexandrium_andersonii.AAC.1